MDKAEYSALKKTVWEKARTITSAFEGSGYDEITGNFDGQESQRGKVLTVPP